jgi:hypothetical protein
MNWKPNPYAMLGLAFMGAPIIAQAKIYVSAEQAQKILLPNKSLTKRESAFGNLQTEAG